MNIHSFIWKYNGPRTVDRNGLFCKLDRGPGLTVWFHWGLIGTDGQKKTEYPPLIIYDIDYNTLLQKENFILLIHYIQLYCQLFLILRLKCIVLKKNIIWLMVVYYYLASNHKKQLVFLSRDINRHSHYTSYLWRYFSSFDILFFYNTKYK